MPRFRSPPSPGLGRVTRIAAILIALGTTLPISHLALSPAYAACAPDGTAGVNVTCTGTDTDGYQVPAPGINNLVIEDGALVTDTAGLGFVGVIDGLGGTVAAFRNAGTVQATAIGRTGVLLDQITVGDFVNTGTINGALFGNGVDIDTLLNGGVINSGTIFGADGLVVRNDILGIDNSGIISGALDDGIFVDGTIGALTNTGSIFGPDDGVDAITITSFHNSGTIFVGDDGVDATTITSLTNSGVIDGLSEGIDADLLISLTNSGTILGGIDGIAADDIGTVINDGTIEGFNFEGIFAVNSIGTVINRGDIFGGDDGVEATNITSLINFGLIDGLDDGIDVDGGGVNNVATSVIGSIINHGTIRGDDEGIDVGTLARLVNTGSVIGDFDPDGDGAGIAAAVITEIINSGLIMTGGDFNTQHAIEERTTGETNLTFNAGSILIGLIDLGGGTNTLNIGAGRSLNSRFDSDDGIATLPTLGTLAGHLVAFDSTATQRQIVAVDQSAFLGFGDALYALTAGIGQATRHRQSAPRSDPALGFASSFASRYAAADETSLTAFSDLDLGGATYLNPNRFWIEGFGAYRQDDGDRVRGDFEHLTGGLVAGVDVPLDALTSVGVMAGFAGATWENEIDTQTNDATSFFAGVYASTEVLGLAWDTSLTVGYTEFDQARETANNLVATGLETASADFGGWFVNPQITMTREAANPLAGAGVGTLLATQTLEQSLTLAYAGLFLDSYTETGTTNPLTLDERSVHIASARAALSLPFEAIHADGALTTVRLVGGVEARTQLGDDTISGTLLGQAVATTLDEDDVSAGAFIGLSGEYQTLSGLVAYANAEALLETSAAYQISARVGLRIAF